MYKRIYMQEKELRGRGVSLTRRVKIIRLQARQSMVESWCANLSAPNTFGQRTVGTIRPCLAEWLDRAQGELTF